MESELHSYNFVSCPCCLTIHIVLIQENSQQDLNSVMN